MLIFFIKSQFDAELLRVYGSLEGPAHPFIGNRQRAPSGDLPVLRDGHVMLREVVMRRWPHPRRGHSR